MEERREKSVYQRALALPVGSVRAIVLLSIIGVIGYMEVTGKAPSDLIRDLAFVVMTYYFANKKKD